MKRKHYKTIQSNPSKSINHNKKGSKRYELKEAIIGKVNEEGLKKLGTLEK